MKVTPTAFRLRLAALCFLLWSPLALGVAPSITSITPAQGPIAGGTLVTIVGANFQGAALSLDSVAMTPQSATATQLTFVTPARQNGIASLRVATTGGNAYGEFLFVPPKLSDLPAGYITTVAGIGRFKGYHRLATQAAVSVAGTGFDSLGNIYLAEPNANRVSVVRTNGILEPFAGSGADSNFSGGNVGDGGPAADAAINFPRGTTADLDGTIYIADQGGRIRRVDAGTGIITTIAGDGSHSFSGDGGQALVAGILNATHITGDGHGTVYFTDFNDVTGGARIRKITPAGIISTVAGNGTQGFSGDGGPATAAQFNFAFADYGAIAVDSHGNLYIADTANFRIRRVDGQTGIITTFLGPNAPIGDALYNLFSVAVDQSDNVYYSYYPGGSAHIVQVDPGGQTIATYGTGTGYSPAGTPLTSLLVGGILTGISIDPAGNIIYSDAYASQVRRLNRTTGFVENVAGVGLQPIGEGGPAIATVLSVGNGALAFLPTGELVIGDAGNFLIRKIDHDGNIAAIAGGGLTSNQVYPLPALGAFVLPLALQADATGRIYMADANGILTISPGGILSRLAGRQDENGLSGDNGPALNALLCQPWDFCRDGAGNIFIADTNNNRIRRVDATTGIITTVAGSGPVNGFEHYSGNGHGSYSGDGGPAIAATLDTPHGVAVDTQGNLFIADSHNNVIRKVDPLGTITTFVFASFPTKLAFDATGNLYGVTTTHQLLRFSAAGATTRIAGSGAFGFAGDGGPAHLAEISAGYQGNGLAIDAEGNIFFLDAQNLRVRAIRQGALLTRPSIATHPSDASVPAGTSVTFTVAVTGLPTPTVQWQVSTDGGDNWADLSNTGPYSGVTTTTLAITAAPAGLNGRQYRVTILNMIDSGYSAGATLGVLPDFYSWQQAKFTGGELLDANVSGPNAVFGRDGLPNLIKYALGLEPKTDITSGLPVVTTLGSDWVYTYTKPATVTDLTYAVEVSTNLTSWTTSGVTHELVSNSGGIDTWRGRYPIAAAGNVFFRLVVTR